MTENKVGNLLCTYIYIFLEAANAHGHQELTSETLDWFISHLYYLRNSKENKFNKIERNKILNKPSN